MIRKIGNFAVFHAENITVGRKNIDKSVTARNSTIEIHFIDRFIFQNMVFHLAVKHYDILTEYKIYISASVFRYAANNVIIQLFVHKTDNIIFHNGYAVVGHSYPKSVLAVFIQTLYTRYAYIIPHIFKFVSVIAYQSAVAAYPDKAVICLCNGICIRCRQTI